MTHAYVSGHYVDHQHASLSIDDRAGLFSDGVYEVVYAESDVLVDWQLHMERLRYSLAGLRIDYHVDDAALQSIALELIERNQLDRSMIYIQISRGVAPRDHAFPKVKTSPSIIVTARALPQQDAQLYGQGAKAILRDDLRWKRRDLKTISLLPNVLAKQDAVEQQAVEAILVEEDGFITEGSASNFFAIDKNAVLYTHPKNNRILGGITREGVIQVAKSLNIPVQEQAIRADQFHHYQEAFITSTTKHILPITQLEGQKVGDGTVGEVSKQLIEGYKAYIQKQIVV